MTTELSKRLGMPRGRQTIRKGGSVTGAGGKASRPIKLWPFDPTPGTLLAKLEAAYMSGLEAVERAEARTKANETSGLLTAEGAKADSLQYILADLVPGLHRARTAITKAKLEVAARAGRSSNSSRLIRRTLLRRSAGRRYGRISKR